MTIELRPYPEYKDSALRWLERIPAHWEEKRAKYYFHEVDERSTTGEEQLMSVSHKTGVTPRKANVTMFMAESNIGYKICRLGDLVINTMWAWMAAMGVAREIGLISPSYGVYRPLQTSSYLLDYVDHLTRTHYYVSEYICRSRGIRGSRLRLYPDDFLSIPIICPPILEQESIIKFISHHDQLFRRFIRNRRQLIEVLNEQKQAVIHRAVTRGLDPDVPLKPSVEDWLGDIPEHWEVRKLSSLGSFSKGRGISKEDITDEGLPAITYGDIYTTYGIETKQLKKSISELLAAKSQEIQKGDLLFTASGETLEDIGKTTLYSGNMPGYAGGDIIILRPNKGDSLYLSYALNSDLGIRQKSMFGRGDIIVHISASKLKQVVVPFPPKDEQILISDFLDNALKFVEQRNSLHSARNRYHPRIPYSLNLRRSHRQVGCT